MGLNWTAQEMILRDQKIKVYTADLKANHPALHTYDNNETTEEDLKAPGTKHIQKCCFIPHRNTHTHTHLFDHIEIKHIKMTTKSMRTLTECDE